MLFTAVVIANVAAMPANDHPAWEAAGQKALADSILKHLQADDPNVAVFLRTGMMP